MAPNSNNPLLLSANASPASPVNTAKSTSTNALLFHAAIETTPTLNATFA